MARAIMLQGTGSDVGKTVLVAGLCRLARNRGLSVRPFKPQNMSNNAAVATGWDGRVGEIGRAQWLQALACGIDPAIDMNPVLLKPQSETGSQIVVHGRVRGTAKGRDYQRLKPTLMSAVLESFGRLRADADLVIVEGAGSPAEVNLRAGDIANMGFARAAEVPVILVGDIDRGGVIASLVGTHAVIDPEDRALVRGFLINKFRGDTSLFDDGLRIVENHTGWPSLGVVPWLKRAADLPAEDSVALERMASPTGRNGKPTVVVPVTPRIANFDDLDPLAREATLDLHYIAPGVPFPDAADMIVLPGSKSTIFDLRAMREWGWVDAIRQLAQSGTRVLGICGGFQMLGRTVRDPDDLEGGGEERGIGLLDVDTVLQPTKTVREVTATTHGSGTSFSGYEIHMGRTEGADCARPFASLRDRVEGACSKDGRIAGTYIHGLFSSGAFRREWLASIGSDGDGIDQLDRVDDALNSIAESLDALIDFDRFLGIAAPEKRNPGAKPD